MKKTFGVRAALAGLLAVVFLLSGCSVTGSVKLGGGISAPKDDGWTDVTVSSTEELFEAIAPDTRITVKPGQYNMSRYIEKIWDDDPDDWNAKHKYVRIDECYDGAMAVVTGVNGLAILGGSEQAADTELVVRPLYANVLSFEDCVDVTMKNLTAGHLQSGECSGSVIYLDNCRGSVFENVDFYGCGVLGLEADYCRGITMTNSILRDCSWGAGGLLSCRGDVLFEDCTMDGSEGGMQIWDCDEANVVFRRCTFGEKESNYLYFMEDAATFEDCKWSEITEYPDDGDYGYDSDDFRAQLEITRFDALVLEDTQWEGFHKYARDGSSDADLTTEDGVKVSFSKDKGVLEGLTDEPIKFDWLMDPESDYVAKLFDAVGDPVGNAYVFILRDEEDTPLYLNIDTEDTEYWFLDPTQAVG